MNLYKAFGLIIETEEVLQELLPVPEYEGKAEAYKGKAEVFIRKGKLPERMEDLIVDTPNVKIGRASYYSDIKNIAEFYVEKGSVIIYEPHERASFETIKLYLLGSCMGAVLLQRRILPLHGSCLNIKGEGVLITGDSGAGKSTIAAALCKKGFRMLTDDVAAIVYQESRRPLVCPGYPSQKLWEDAIDRMDIRGEKLCLNRSSNELNKYSVGSLAYYEDNPLLLTRIIEIIPSEEEALRMEEVKGAHKLEVILRNTYRKPIIDAMGLREWYFRQCLLIAEQAGVYRILRPHNKHLEQDIAGLITVKIAGGD